MHLESVLVEGFKSYSLPTEMHFNPGIGVVVGNNGVGKSNIIDAIAWALGEDDLDRLRCYAREDLFFSGSRDAPPAEIARVRLNVRKGSDAPPTTLERSASRAGPETCSVDGRALGREEYAVALRRVGLVDSLKTLIRQEQLNDWFRLGPVERWQEALALLGRNPGGDNEELVGLWGESARRYFRLLLPEGDCRLFTLPVNGDIGLDVEVRFPDKGPKRSKLLSGGERTITSLAAKLALFDQLTSGLYLLDEVEPALDYVNHKNMQELLKTLARERQMIMITHLRSTLDLADTVHGVRTRGDGTSFMKFFMVMDERLLRLYKCC